MFEVLLEGDTVFHQIAPDLYCTYLKNIHIQSSPLLHHEYLIEILINMKLG